MALTNNNNTKSLFDFEVSEKETGSYEDYEKMKAYELDEGVIFNGTPFISWFVNEDKKYDAIRLRIVDDDVKELLDCYINIPKKDNEGNVRRLTESFAFYNPAFNFVKKTIEIMDGSDLENVKQINRININDILQVYEDAAKVAVKIIKSVDDNGYNTFEILSIE